MNISPGNLYYHYRSKDEIVTKIFAQFERELDELFAMGRTVRRTWKTPGSGCICCSKNLEVPLHLSRFE